MYKIIKCFILFFVLSFYAFSQVSFDKLEFRDYDLVYIKSDSVPFTGKCIGNCIVFKSSLNFGQAYNFFKGDIVLYVKGKYKKGKEEGKWIYMMRDKKTIRGIQKFKRGKRNGKYRLFYDNGQIWKKCKYKKDKLDGMFYIYDIDGNIIYSSFALTKVA